jgi:hypothetical protein
MFEKNDKKTDKAQEMRGGGGALNALHEARAEIHSVHEEGTDGVQTTLSGHGGALLALLSIIVMNLMETMTKHGIPAFIAAKAITEAVKKGFEEANKK